MWEKQIVKTSRGAFEIFTKGSGEPICITHLYSEFNELGNYFADVFIEEFTVYLINLKEAGNSCKVMKDEELSMRETCLDLEAIRIALGLERWSYAGHSTGGMLGLYYVTLFPSSLSKLLVGGATATNKYMDHEKSMYCPKSPLNSKLKEIFAVLKSANSTIEENRQANKEWTDLSLYNVEKREEYFSKPSSGKVVQKRLDYYSFYDLPKYDILTELTKVKVPIFVYCGRYDAQCPLYFSEEINENLIESKLYIYERSNHLPFIEEKEQFIEMVSDFKKLVLNVTN
ncbi:alpha/beta fold hydrolase [Gottfriedia solisilvae]|uniref:Proline iminopeptidase n=1 Tax=Gottfriedia solisilvae TaxID=1516104 RepID=A0A8J3EY62_9BACI|nr:alpha/beta fold hydrolase [Gottfriedia solisilvae]GGI12991.1 proline iminopeptidase [Gottfriedia solisilvae]